MERFFIDYLRYWKDKKGRKPLIIRGARQVGKTYAVREFGKKYFESIIEINFEEKEVCEIFRQKDLEMILQTLELIYNQKVTDNTLIFIDEIQACPEAIKILRFFYEKYPQYAVIAAGSLLDFTLRDFKFSMPVGRVEFAYMYPMNFYEFLAGIGEENTVDFLKKYEYPSLIPEILHKKFIDLLRLYYIVGGMPEAVRIYARTRSLKEVEIVHESIMTSVKYDFAKYGSRSQRHLLVKILNYIPKSIGRKFKYSKVDSQTRNEKIKSAFELLVYARLVHKIKNSLAQEPPLEYSVKENFFKPLFLDIGLANHLLKLPVIEPEDIIFGNRGSLAEQFVGQQFLAQAPFYKDKQLFYWQREKRNAEAEIDYLKTFGNKIIPIEIKSGKSGTLKSLHVFVAERKNKIAIRFYAGMPGISEIKTAVRIGASKKEISFKLINLPLYLALEADRILNQAAINIKK